MSINRRIQELTIQALGSCDPEKMSSSIYNLAGTNIPLEFSKKFAELIVKECTAHLREIDWEYDVPEDDFSQNAAVMLAANGLEAYFGIDQ